MAGAIQQYAWMHAQIKVRLQGYQAIFTWLGMRDQKDFWFFLYINQGRN